MLIHSQDLILESAVIERRALIALLPHAAIAAAVLPAVDGLDDDRARFYYDLVYNSLNEAARRIPVCKPAPPSNPSPSVPSSRYSARDRRVRNPLSYALMTPFSLVSRPDRG